MSTHSSVCAHVHDVQDFTASDVNERLLAAKKSNVAQAARALRRCVNKSTSWCSEAE